MQALLMGRSPRHCTLAPRPSNEPASALSKKAWTPRCGSVLALEAVVSWRGDPGAFLIALACSTPPDGRKHWPMQWLADKLVELKHVESISDETVRRTLKKTRCSPG
jgi:hypothetical protein